MVENDSYDNQTDASAGAAPYIAFATFQTALDTLAGNGVPNIVDRHSFPSFSGGIVNGTLSAFRFFGLIDHNGTPLPALHTLANDKDGRKNNIKNLLEKFYSTVFALNLSGATPPQLDQAFSAKIYNVNGDTKKKAKTFFLKAAQYAEIPVSKLLTKKIRSSAPRKPRAKKPDSNKANGNLSGTGLNNVTASMPPVHPATGESKTINLLSGGTLTVTINVSMMSLSSKDREFVFALIDNLQQYETGTDKVES